MARNPKVNDYMRKLDHPLKPVVELLRESILAADAKLAERIKWNAPSFGYGNDDRITFNLRARDKVQLIFHRGAKAKADKAFAFKDPSGLMEWITNDRGIVSFDGSARANAKKAAFTRLVKAWLKATT
jgi:hypothetical protein